MRSFFGVACLLTIISCGPGQNSVVKDALSSEDKVLFEKYLIQGKDLYKLKCQNCHMGNGKGLRTLIPPLMAADYLEQNQPKVACLIKNGAQKMLTVNGIEYNPTMPAHTVLTNLEIAEVMTYINNSWGNEIGLVKAIDIQNWLEACD